MLFRHGAYVSEGVGALPHRFAARIRSEAMRTTCRHFVRRMGERGCTTVTTTCCNGPVVLSGQGGFPPYLTGWCPRCQQPLVGAQQGVIVARPLALAYDPSAELRAYLVGRFRDGQFQRGPWPGGPGVWDLEPVVGPRSPHVVFDTPEKMRRP